MGFAQIEHNHQLLSGQIGYKAGLTTSATTRYRAEILISVIEKKVYQQLDVILNNAKFVRLHRAWLGLYYLVEQADQCEEASIRVFSISWLELKRDLQRHTEYEDTLLFQHLYSNEFDMPGGKPYNIVIGDYMLDVTDKNDMASLEIISEVCQSAFCTFITGVVPTIFGIDDFSEMNTSFDIIEGFEHRRFDVWQQLRSRESASFVALCLPRVLFDDYYQKRLMQQRPSVSEPRHYWVHQCYCLAAMMVKCFEDTGWFLDSTSIIGEANNRRGGIIPNIQAPYFVTDFKPRINAFSTECLITEQQEQELQMLGFMSLCHGRHGAQSVYYHLPMIKSVEVDAFGNPNYQQMLAASLPYMLCVNRFAHYIKIIGRNKIGSHITAQECQSELHRWIMQYVASNTDISIEMKSRFPLRKAVVKVNEHAWQRDALVCAIDISPHLRTSHAMAVISLKTTIIGQRNVA